MLPRPKVELLPTFYLPDAAGATTAVTDSSPLLRRFEAEFAGPPVRPADPVRAFFDSLRHPDLYGFCKDPNAGQISSLSGIFGFPISKIICNSVLGNTVLV